MGQTDAKRLLADLLKPIKVKQVTFTRSDRYCIQGLVIAYCPVEKRDSGKDFKIELAGRNPISVVSVIVDGRVLYPKIDRTRSGRQVN